MHQYKKKSNLLFLCYNQIRSDNMKLGIASDHRGYHLKEKIKEAIEDIEIVDFGTNSDTKFKICFLSHHTFQCMSYVFFMIICGYYNTYFFITHLYNFYEMIADWSQGRSFFIKRGEK